MCWFSCVVYAWGHTRKAKEFLFTPNIAVRLEYFESGRTHILANHIEESTGVELSMLFCRGCGKQIHETAPSCPHCGAPQVQATTREKNHWASIVALITGVVVLLMAFTEPDGKWEKDAILGGLVLGAIPISFALYSFSQSNKNGRWMAVTGLILGILVVLVSLGSK